MEVTGGSRMCIDGQGRYDGPATATVGHHGRVFKITGQFRAEFPTGQWICEDTWTGRRLAVTYDADRWARSLFGVDVGDVRGPMKGGHIAALPEVYCLLGQDWARVAKEGLAPDPDLGDLTKRGVTAEVLVDR